MYTDVGSRTPDGSHGWENNNNSTNIPEIPQESDSRAYQFKSHGHGPFLPHLAETTLWPLGESAPPSGRSRRRTWMSHHREKEDHRRPPFSAKLRAGSLHLTDHTVCICGAMSASALRSTMLNKTPGSITLIMSGTRRMTDASGCRVYARRVNAKFEEFLAS